MFFRTSYIMSDEGVFCDCGSVFTQQLNTVSGLYEKYCSICGTYTPNDGPVLFELEFVDKEHMNKLTKIKAAIYDDTCSVVNRSCPECGAEKMKFILDNDMKRTYICNSCKRYFS